MIEVPPQPSPEALAHADRNEQIRKAVYTIPRGVGNGELAIGVTIIQQGGADELVREYVRGILPEIGIYATDIQAASLRESVAQGGSMQELSPELWLAFKDALYDDQFEDDAIKANIALIMESGEAESAVASFAERKLAAVKAASYQTPSTVEVGELTLGTAIIKVDEITDLSVNFVRVTEPGTGVYADDDEAEERRGVSPDGGLTLTASDEMWKTLLLAVQNGEFNMDELKQALLKSPEAA